MKTILARTLLLFALAMSFSTAQADALEHSIAGLQHEWASAYYNAPKSEKEAQFKVLIVKSEQLVKANPGAAEPLIWNAIILSSAAKFDGGLGALGMIKSARSQLLEAEKIDPAALDGSVYTSLGSLYAKAPGWPLAFGDKDKASNYLKKALALNPNGIDPNFFYGELLLDRGDKANAKTYLARALRAPARPGREDADAGRRQEIQDALAHASSL